LADYAVAQRFIDVLKREMAMRNNAIAIVEKRCANSASDPLPGERSVM
jgi:hypothetical protein